MTHEPHNLDTLGPYELAWLIVLLFIVNIALCSLCVAIDDHRECRGAVLVQCYVQPETCVGYGEYVCEQSTNDQRRE